jgi:hypothetical protein
VAAPAVPASINMMLDDATVLSILLLRDFVVMFDLCWLFILADLYILADA